MAHEDSPGDHPDLGYAGFALDRLGDRRNDPAVIAAEALNPARRTALYFPRVDPVVIMLVTRGERCLLGRQPRFPAGMWSCLAGFVEPGETLEEAVRRETREEAGVAIGRVRYELSQPWPFPSQLMVGMRAEALGEELRPDDAELDDARWFDRAEAAAMLERRHPQGWFAPPAAAIAHHLLRRFVSG